MNEPKNDLLEMAAALGIDGQTALELIEAVKKLTPVQKEQIGELAEDYLGVDIPNGIWEITRTVFLVDGTKAEDTRIIEGEWPDPEKNDDQF